MSISSTAATAPLNRISINPSSTLRCQARGNLGPNGTSASGTVAFSLGTWSQVVGIIQADGSCVAYTNGADRQSTINTEGDTFPTVNTTTIAVLKRTTNGQSFGGVVAEPAIWNVELTDGEIAQLAKGESPRNIRRGSLVFYAPMRASDRLAYDEIGRTVLALTGSSPAPFTREPVPRITALARFHNRWTKPAGASTFNKTLTASFTANAALARRPGKLLKASFSATAALKRRVGKIVSASTVKSATMTKRVGKKLTASTAKGAFMIRARLKTLTASYTAHFAPVKQPRKLLIASIGWQASVTSAVTKGALWVKKTAATGVWTARAAGSGVWTKVARGTSNWTRKSAGS